MLGFGKPVGGVGHGGDAGGSQVLLQRLRGGRKSSASERVELLTYRGDEKGNSLDFGGNRTVSLY